MVNGWKECLITDVLKQDGIKIGPFGSQLKKEMLLNDGFLKVYGQENVYENDFNIGDKYLTREHFEKIKSCEILPGDFLMSTMGTIGKCAIVPPNIMPGIMDSHLIRLRFDESMINPEYVLQLFSDQYSFLQDQIQKLAVGGIMDGLSVGIVSNIRIVFPEDLEEQNCIVSTLKDADKLMHESQLLIEKYQAMKQGCLQHMFPRKGQTEPDVRLPGFTGAWEQRKLGDCFLPLQNNTLSRADLSDENGVVMNVHYGDVLIKFEECLDVSKERLPFVKKQSVADKFATSYLKNGDVIVADTAEDETVGKCTEIIGLTDQKVISGLHTIPLRPNGQFATGYLGFYLNSAAYHTQLKPLMQGIKVTSISKSAMQDTVIKYPSDVKEQALIGQYFMNLDHLITLHQRKCEKYKMIKQGMMEDLLTGKVRLK